MVFLKESVKPITNFDAQHHKVGGFQENTIGVFSIPIPCILC